MYAVIQTGGKQYRVSEGQILTVEKLDVEAGKTVEFSNVLAISDDSGLKIGAPFVSGAKVVANVIGEGRHDKIRIIKFRRRKHYRKQQGHRQYFTKLEIKSIK
ncbi:MAG: 50S ribosomal protein L21 [Gammaproteobacteria bacterium]|nr:50S ribosomal protein L21 [Gammaproteobacteria bacterium]